MTPENDAGTSVREIIDGVRCFAPETLQESYDNSGLQVDGAGLDSPCSGVLLALDPTPEAVASAIDKGCNLLITHHPLLFRGLKTLAGDTPAERAVIMAVRGGVTVYSAHTSLDKAAGGVSARMAEILGLEHIAPLEPVDAGSECGLGAVGSLPSPMQPEEFLRFVKSRFGCAALRHTLLPCTAISRVALCGGSGASLCDNAIAAGADAFVSADFKYHDFADAASRILIADIGHFESEICTKKIFHDLIKEKFPNFAPLYSATENNPINYM